MSDDKKVIQDRMLSNISNDYDKGEGSFFYDIVKPIAIELENLGVLADEILNRGFADTAKGIYLDKIVSEQGLTRKYATKATTSVTITGNTGATINIGDKVSSDLVNYISLESKSIKTGQTTMIVNVECELAGSIGNVPAGAIKHFPVTIAGLTAVTNTTATTNGFNEETDEELRRRYYAKVQTPATSGNKYHYLNWAKEVTGVGDAKVFPLANGPGTVKVVIVNANKRAADNTLIDSVVANIEDSRPIGATVSVVSATEKVININVSLTIDTNNYSLEGITTGIEDTITNYFKDISFKESYVSYAKIGNLIFDVPGVLDYSNLKLNNGITNITISDIEVPVFGGVTIG